MNRFNCLILFLVGLLFATAAVAAAQTTRTPSQDAMVQPAPTSTPRFTYSVKIRAWNLYRQNASDAAQDGADKAVNQAGFNLGIAPHVEYHAWKGLSLGSTYQYANPVNGSCVTPQSHLAPPCEGGTLDFDDSLPSYRLSTLFEAYVTWKDPRFYVKAGNQVINTPWAPDADSRIKPSAYQGVDASYALGEHWLVQATRIMRFEFRNQSDFSRSTLLTSSPPGAGGVPSNIYNPTGTPIETSGYTMGRLRYTTGSLEANAWYYGFAGIANAYWVEGKYTFASSPLRPYVAVQMGSERSSGQSVVGKIDSHVYGILGGADIVKNVLLEIGYDRIPVRTDRVTLPSGYTCATDHTIALGNVSGSLPYFLPSGGTANCTNNDDGTTNLYYGGWASPYGDSLAADPLFTTSLTQGMVDRRSPGQSYLTRVTYTSTNRKLVASATFAGYDYGNPGGAQKTHETDADVLYYFSKPAALGQNYKGFTLHYRYGARYQSGSPFPAPNGYGGPPLFKYDRYQLEYDF